MGAIKPLAVLIPVLALLAGTAHAASSNLRSIKLVSVTTKASTDAGPAHVGEPTDEAAVNAVHESDRLYNAAAQFDKPKQAQVGTDTAVLVHYASGRSWMSATAKLPGGTIRSRGYLRNVENEALVPVVGGTGKYAHVTGWLEIRNLRNTVFAANIYTLRG